MVQDLAVVAVLGNPGSGKASDRPGVQLFSGTYRWSPTGLLKSGLTTLAHVAPRKDIRQPIDQVTIPSEMGIALKCLRQRKISIKLLLLRLYHMHIMTHM